MSLSRADVISYASGGLEDVLELAGLSPADDFSNLKPAIDSTFRNLGVAQANLESAAVEDGEEEKALAFAEYYVLNRALKALANKMSVSAGSAKAELQQQYDHVKELMLRALVIAQGYGLIIAGVGKSGLIPVPYAGGISKSDYDSVASNDDNVALFRVFRTDDAQVLLLDEELAQ